MKKAEEKKGNGGVCTGGEGTFLHVMNLARP
jgi:hypothetical protein